MTSKAQKSSHQWCLNHFVLTRVKFHQGRENSSFMSRIPTFSVRAHQVNTFECLYHSLRSFGQIKFPYLHCLQICDHSPTACATRTGQSKSYHNPNLAILTVGAFIHLVENFIQFYLEAHTCPFWFIRAQATLITMLFGKVGSTPHTYPVWTSFLQLNPCTTLPASPSRLPYLLSP